MSNEITLKWEEHYTLMRLELAIANGESIKDAAAQIVAAFEAAKHEDGQCWDMGAVMEIIREAYRQEL